MAKVVASRPGKLKAVRMRVVTIAEFDRLKSGLLGSLHGRVLTEKSLFEVGFTPWEIRRCEVKTALFGLMVAYILYDGTVG